MIVASVFRPGKAYSEEWVRRLQRTCAKNLPPHEFVCLTNERIGGIDTRPLLHSWPSWWAKIELFRPNLFDGPVLYTDLDAFLTKPFAELLDPRSNLTMLTDYYKHMDNSSLMAWDASDPFYEGIYNNFVNNSTGIMEDYEWKGPGEVFSDQGYIADYCRALERPIDRWQDVLPAEKFLHFSAVGSYNPAVLDWRETSPASYVYCLGDPKFDTSGHLPIVAKHWN